MVSLEKASRFEVRIDFGAWGLKGLAQGFCAREFAGCGLLLDIRRLRLRHKHPAPAFLLRPLQLYSRVQCIYIYI